MDVPLFRVGNPGIGVRPQVAFSLWENRTHGDWIATEGRIPWRVGPPGTADICQDHCRQSPGMLLPAMPPQSEERKAVSANLDAAVCSAASIQGRAGSAYLSLRVAAKWALSPTDQHRPSSLLDRGKSGWFLRYISNCCFSMRRKFEGISSSSCSTLNLRS